MDFDKYCKENRDRHVKRISKWVGNFEDAEEIVQEALCKAFQNLEKFNPKKSKFDTWVNTIINNTVRNFKRDNNVKTRSIEEYDATYEIEDISPDDIPKLLEPLSPLLRERATLRYVKGYSVKDIAKIVGATPVTVAKSLHEVRRILSEHYSDSHI